MIRGLKTKLKGATLLLIFGKDGVDMVALFLAQRIVLGKMTFKQVPAVLKPAVREMLIDSGLPELAVEE